MTSNHNTLNIKVNQIPEILRLFLGTRDQDKHLVPLFLSNPGVGKTTSIKQFVDDLNLAEPETWELLDYSLLQTTPEDLRGAISFDESGGLKTSVSCPPKVFPIKGYPESANGKKVLVFFDELKTAPQLIQQLATSLIDGRIGDYQIDQSRTFFVLASNYDVEGTFEVPANLINRVCVINVQADYETWRDWAVTRSNPPIFPVIIDFLRAYPQHLSHPKPDNSHGFPSPRSWEDVNQLLERNKRTGAEWTDNSMIINPLIIGYLGPTIGFEFINTLNFDESVTHINFIESGEFSRVSSTPHIQRALVGAILYSTDIVGNMDARIKKESLSYPPGWESCFDTINKYFEWMERYVDVALVISCMSGRSEETRQRTADFIFSTPAMHIAQKHYELICQKINSATSSVTDSN